jgi:hypothetical protein
VTTQLELGPIWVRRPCACELRRLEMQLASDLTWKCIGGAGPHQSGRACRSGGRGDPDLLRLPGGALAAHPHQQPARAASARETTHACGRSIPDGQSALNLAAARLRHVAGTAWSSKRYLNVQLLKDQQMRGPSPLEPVTRAAQLKPKCERFWTPPTHAGCHPL